MDTTQFWVIVGLFLAQAGLFLVGFARLGARIDALEVKLTTRIDAVEAKLGAHIDQLSARIDAVEDRLSARIDAVENRLINTIQSVEKRLGADISHVEAKIDALDDRLTGRIDKILEERARREPPGVTSLAQSISDAIAEGKPVHIGEGRIVGRFDLVEESDEVGVTIPDDEPAND